MFGDDYEFIEDLVNLVLDSSITIGIYDNTTISETEFISGYNDNTWVATRTNTITSEYEQVDSEPVYEYDEELEEDVLIGYEPIYDWVDYDPEIGEWSHDISTGHNYSIEYNKVYSDLIEIQLTNLDIWIMKYDANYTYIDGEEENPNLANYYFERHSESDGKFGSLDSISSQYSPSENWSNIEWTSVDSDTRIKTQTETRIQTNTNQYFNSSAENFKSRKYVKEGITEVKEKTNNKAKPGDWDYPNFCTIYLDAKLARSNIADIESWLFEILENNESTVDMVDLTKYLFYCALEKDYGVTEFNFNRVYNPNNFSNFSGIYGATIQEKVWFALKDAGLSEKAAAGVMGNLYAESGFRTNNLEDSFESILGYTDETYTQAIDSGEYSLESFISDHTSSNCGAGYGLAQWTFYSLKEGLYNYAKSLDVSIADEDMQIEYLLGQIVPGAGASGFAEYSLLAYNGYTVDNWKNAETPEDAAEAFCWIFEKPNEQYANVEIRRTKAREYYDKYKGLEKPNFGNGQYSAEEIENGIIGIYTTTKNLTHILYIQGGNAPWGDNDYGNSGSMRAAGCGPTALAIIASAYNSEITPETTRSATIYRYGRGNNSSADCMRQVLSDVGVNVSTSTGYKDKQKIIDCLQNGGQIWLVVEACQYTSGYHCISLIDYNSESDNVYVAHGTQDYRPYGWESLDYVLNYNSSPILYIGG